VYAVAAGVIQRATPSSVAQKPFTPDEFTVVGVAEMTNSVLAPFTAFKPVSAIV
jgi:hypothetical protein